MNAHSALARGIGLVKAKGDTMAGNQHRLDEAAVSVCPPDVLSKAAHAFAKLIETDRRYASARYQIEMRKSAKTAKVLRDRLEARRQGERRRFEQKLARAHARLSEAMLADLTSRRLD
jgi:hypothetical protein